MFPCSHLLLTAFKRKHQKKVGFFFPFLLIQSMSLVSLHSPAACGPSSLLRRLPWLWVFPLWWGSICQRKDLGFCEGGIKIQLGCMELSLFATVLVKTPSHNFCNSNSSMVFIYKQSPSCSFWADVIEQSSKSALGVLGPLFLSKMFWSCPTLISQKAFLHSLNSWG